MTKISNNKPAPNPKSVFVLNFENWALQIAWNLGFEYWNLVRLVYPFENGILPKSVTELSRQRTIHRRPEGKRPVCRLPEEFHLLWHGRRSGIRFSLRQPGL